MPSKPIKPATIFFRNPDIIAADMDGDLVMMSIEQGSYFGLQGVGPFIWEMLETPISFSDLCKKITAEYDVDLTTCEEDVKEFVEKLLESELVLYIEKAIT